ncbi:hypothetical protein WP1_276 [Pseudomonas phage WP1]
MDSAKVAVYGVKKLAISCEKGQEALALDNVPERRRSC